MCFGGSYAPNTNVTPAPYSLSNSQTAVTKTQTAAAQTPNNKSGLVPSAYDPNVVVPSGSPLATKAEGAASPQPATLPSGLTTTGM
ncbi:hypothetical protein M2322_002684 [Rhodoblastus acidophilus]|nr:hypothetical protein [Rhodoblastus acidophilus]